MMMMMMMMMSYGRFSYRDYSRCDMGVSFYELFQIFLDGILCENVLLLKVRSPRILSFTCL